MDESGDMNIAVEQGRSDWFDTSGDAARPPFESVAELLEACTRLNLTPNDLLGYGGDDFSNPLVKVLMANIAGRSLESLADVSEYFNIYDLVQSGATGIKVRRLGKKSLAALTTRTSNRIVFQTVLDFAYPKSYRQRFIDAYERATRLGLDLRIEGIKRKIVAANVGDVDVRYLRLLARIHQDDGPDVIVNYSSRV